MFPAFEIHTWVWEECENQSIRTCSSFWKEVKIPCLFFPFRADLGAGQATEFSAVALLQGLWTGAGGGLTGL